MTSFQGPMVDCDATEDCTEGAKMFGTRHPGKKNLQNVIICILY